jgi:hypothetical protein
MLEKEQLFAYFLFLEEIDQFMIVQFGSKDSNFYLHKNIKEF